MINSIKFKRIVAYFIDLLIISLLVTLISNIKALNPNRDKYNKTLKEYSAYNEELSESISNMESITANDLITDEYVKYMYDLEYYGVSYRIIELAVVIIYFTVLPFYNKGRTFGKEFMKITVVNEDGSKAYLWKHLIRALVIPIATNIILYSSFVTAFNIGLVFFMQPKGYFYANTIITFISTVLCYANIVFLLGSKKELALHDKILKTKVVEYVKS